MPRPRQRIYLESGLKLDVNKLMRQGVLRKGERSGPFVTRWTNTYTGQITASALLGADMRSQHEGQFFIQIGDLKQTIILTPRCRAFGGHQWYFMCPREDRCCSVLWRPPGASEFRCRQGWGGRVAYTSQFLDRTHRAHRGQSKIKVRLQANSDLELWELPQKPKWMRWTTYDRLAEKFYGYESILGEGVDELLAKLFAK